MRAPVFEYATECWLLHVDAERVLSITADLHGNDEGVAVADAALIISDN